jgi:hypothetical protein
MPSLHAYYDQLPEQHKYAVDCAYRALTDVLKEYTLRIENNDVAERVVDAIARGILESNQTIV